MNTTTATFPPIDMTNAQLTEAWDALAPFSNAWDSLSNAQQKWINNRAEQIANVMEARGFNDADRMFNL